MVVAIDLTGKPFGRLLVVERAPSIKGQAAWLCRCDCGREKVVKGYVLRSKRSKSCGCLRRELGVTRGRASRRHGEASNRKETVEYRTWSSMRCRCLNPNHKLFSHYGKRGITVCDRWSKFENFLVDMGRRPSKYHSLDRIDNDGSYSPENCRWATWEQQNRNQRKRREWRKVTIDGETRPLAEWLRLHSVSRNTYDSRRSRGLSIEEAITRPVRHKRS